MFKPRLTRELQLAESILISTHTSSCFIANRVGGGRDEKPVNVFRHMSWPPQRRANFARCALKVNACGRLAATRRSIESNTRTKIEKVTGQWCYSPRNIFFSCEQSTWSL
ncbi:hypothetical protein LSAT2_004844 [Lamellibrachia satsuma]|nr:hypothetical protein LSAT2_004844 [Lamellibrachia satsuma]